MATHTRTKPAAAKPLIQQELDSIMSSLSPAFAAHMLTAQSKDWSWFADRDTPDRYSAFIPGRDCQFAAVQFAHLFNLEMQKDVRFAGVWATHWKPEAREAGRTGQYYKVSVYGLTEEITSRFA